MQWDTVLYKQDKFDYYTYHDYFDGYPLNCTAFPVTWYEYAVSSHPSTIRYNNLFLKGVSVGEYTDQDTKEIKEALTLMVMTSDSLAQEVTYVNSRNAP